MKKRLRASDLAYYIVDYSIWQQCKTIFDAKCKQAIDGNTEIQKTLFSAI